VLREKSETSHNSPFEELPCDPSEEYPEWEDWQTYSIIREAKRNMKELGHRPGDPVFDQTMAILTAMLRIARQPRLVP